MGKIKQPEPEPEGKIIRIVGENLSIDVTGDEKKYRNKHGPDDITDVPRDKMKCTVCAKSIADVVKKGLRPYVHTVLDVLMCKECASFYGDGYFSVDEDGDDKYCRWCGQGGTLYLCSACSCAFCKKCIKENLDKSALKDLESDDWKCLICNPKPLFACRTVCWYLQEYAEKSKSNNQEFEEEDLSSKPKCDKTKSLSIEEAGSSKSRKRKASEINENEGSDKDKSVKKTKQDESVISSIKTRRHSNRAKNISDSEGEDSKSLALVSRPKRSASQQEDSKPTKRLSRTKDKTIDDDKVIVLSDNESDSKERYKKETPKRPSNSSKKSKRTSSSTKRKSISKRKHSENKDKDQTKRSSLNNSSKSSEGSSKRTSRSSGKTAVEKKHEYITPIKRTQRTSTKNTSYNETNDSSCKKKSLFLPLDENSSSEPENKKKAKKSKVQDGTPKLKIDKNADIETLQGYEYISSALTDITELSVLISGRCEKLCSKSVRTSDDIFSVLNKIKHLMKGAHTNLELIEKGLNNKINEWKGDQQIDDTNGKNSVLLSDDNDQKEDASISCSIIEGETSTNPKRTDSEGVDGQCTAKLNENETMEKDTIETETEKSADKKTENIKEECALYETSSKIKEICQDVTEHLSDSEKTNVKKENESHETESQSEETEPVITSGIISKPLENNEMKDECNVSEDESPAKNENEEELNESLIENTNEEQLNTIGNGEQSNKDNAQEQLIKTELVDEKPNDTKKSSEENPKDNFSENEIALEDLMEEKSNEFEDNNEIVNSTSECDKKNEDFDSNKGENDSIFPQSDVPITTHNKEVVCKKDLENSKSEDRVDEENTDQVDTFFLESDKTTKSPDQDGHKLTPTNQKDDLIKIDNCTVEDKVENRPLEDENNIATSEERGKECIESKKEENKTPHTVVDQVENCTLENENNITSEENRKECIESNKKEIKEEKKTPRESSVESRSSDSSQRSMEDKGRYHHDSQRRYNDRNRDYNRDRDRYHDRYQQRGSYHSYDNRWSSSSWGYHR